MADTGRIDAAERAVKGGIYKAVAAFFEYDTPKIVHIRSKTVGIINRLLQLIIIAYIIGYAIIYEKGYQEFDDVESAVTSKLKGVVYSDHEGIDPKYNRIWDVADYVQPPQENDAFFVMTNVVMSVGQQQDVCSESPDVPDGICETSADCPANTPVINGNGVRTGRCIGSTKEGIKTCEIHAWCPVEIDELPLNNTALLEDSKNFTVLIKNYIEFPKFQQKRRNVLETSNASFLMSCHYKSDDNDLKYCPIFTLGTIVHEAGENYEEIAIKGGVMGIHITWDCNLDYKIENCKPVYEFSRFDNKNAKIAKGWNFRYANYYSNNGTAMRDLYKAYGIRFIISVTGTAGKFNIVPLLMNLGSGIALLALATVLCDIIMIYILKSGNYYESKKYLFVTGDDAFEGGPLLNDNTSISSTNQLTSHESLED